MGESEDQGGGVCSGEILHLKLLLTVSQAHLNSLFLNHHLNNSDAVGSFHVPTFHVPTVQNAMRGGQNTTYLAVHTWVAKYFQGFFRLT